MSIASAINRFLVRLDVTSTDGTPGLSVFGLNGSDPTAAGTDPVAAASPLAHGLAVGADGSLWTANGTSWAQLAGAGGTLGPVPTGVSFQIGDDATGNSTLLYDGSRVRWLCGSVTSGAGRFIQIQSGNTTAAGQAPGDILLVPGENATDGTTGDVVLNRGGMDLSAATTFIPAAYSEADTDKFAIPMSRVIGVLAGAVEDFSLDFDAYVASAVVYTEADGSAGQTVTIARDPAGANTALLTSAAVDASATAALLLPGGGGKVSAGTVIRVNNAGCDGAVNVILTVLAFRA